MPTFRPGKPVAELVLATGGAAAAGTNALPLDTIVHEDPSGYVTAPGSPITITHDGVYLVSAAVHRSSTTVSSVLYLTLRVNGVDHTMQRQLVGSAGGVAAASLAAILYLISGDTVQAFYSNPSGAPTLVAGTTRFAITRIGPKQWTG